MTTNYDSVEQLAPKLVTPPGCITTFTGKLVNLFKPDPKLICLEDIAHGLANTCRWNGHTKTFYSVAEHAVRVSRLVPKGKRLTAIFHDAEEAYWGDIVSPLKMMLPPEIITKIVEFRQVIFDRFNVADICDVVDAADKAEMYWDWENVMKNMKYVGQDPMKAKKEWLWHAKINLANIN